MKRFDVHDDPCAAADGDVDALSQSERMIAWARRGSKNALGELLDGCRQYLLLIANQEFGADLQAKAGASDLVQETFLEAQRDFSTFSGTSHDELIAWLRRILLNNLSNFARRYRDTEKRRVARERPFDDGSDVRLDELFDSDVITPSGCAIRNERADLLRRAMDRLPADYRRVLVLRHRERQSFSQIGMHMKRSADAARMLWWRAFERLGADLQIIDERDDL